MLVVCALLTALASDKTGEGLSLGVLIFDWVMTSLCFVCIHFIGMGVAIAAGTRWLAMRYM